MRRNILKDTLLLTAIQMTLDGLSLLLNVFITGRLGASSMGILSLTTSFFSLTSVIAGGNAFLCASRFVSEELGKKNGDPRRILLHCLTVSLILSAVTALGIGLLAPVCSVRFFKIPTLSAPIRLLALSLPLLTICACMRGYFNACCAVRVCGTADVLGFLVRGAVTAGVAALCPPQESGGLCTMTVLCTCAGSLVSLIYLLWELRRLQVPTGKASINLKTYLWAAIPVMGGSMLSSFLSAANDALVPLTLSQSGNSPQEALAQFGIFEAIVIPALFFPSTLLCSLSGILVTESARESAACNRSRIGRMTEKTLSRTMLYAIFTAGIFWMFGRELGELLGGGELAGRLLQVLAPVIPFIYLEIVLESLLKGMGQQGFSSLNYLAEYTVRISIVLIFVPVMGFYGVVLSYYASNVCGNISRLIKLILVTGVRPGFWKCLGEPLLVFALSGGLCSVLFNFIKINPENSIPGMTIFTVLAGILYFGIELPIFGKRKTVLIWRKKREC